MDEDWEIDMIDRLLEQGDEIKQLDPQYETWAAELRGRKEELELSPRVQHASENKDKKRRHHKKKRTSPRSRSAVVILPAWITDSTRWQERMAEKAADVAWPT